jgi:pyruvate,orthophosphate dikinase
MFFEARRLPFLHKMIMTDLPIERREALEALLPFQRDDFAGLFRAMDGLPVITRLIDPPLHEFLPNHMDLNHELMGLKFRLKHADTLEKFDSLLQQVNEKAKVLKRVESLHESNPMLGLRGVRLGIQIPELTTMQVRAIFEAACLVTKEGVVVHPEIMIPLTSHVNELKAQRDILEIEAQRVMHEQGIEIDYKFGTMIEIPRAALTAHQLAQHAAFFSFGTNDLTQTVFGMSRDDAEAGFLIRYMRTGILPENPFTTLDRDGVGQLMALCLKKARSVNPDLECGICGEHAGDPQSISLCHEIGLTYVSCSPYRVPVARLSAAHAALRDKTVHG